MKKPTQKIDKIKALKAQIVGLESPSQKASPWLSQSSLGWCRPGSMSLLVIRLNVSSRKSSANTNLMANLEALRNRAIHCKRRNYKEEQEEEDKGYSTNNAFAFLVKHHFLTIKSLET